MGCSKLTIEDITQAADELWELCDPKNTTINVNQPVTLGILIRELTDLYDQIGNAWSPNHVYVSPASYRRLNADSVTIHPRDMPSILWPQRSDIQIRYSLNDDTIVVEPGDRDG